MEFHKLELEDLKRVRLILEKELPSSAMALNIVDMSIRLNKKYLSDGVVEIYEYNGMSAENLFLVIFLKPKNLDVYSTVFINTEVDEEMLQAFSKLHNWSKAHMFGAIPMTFSSHLERLVKEKGGKIFKGPAADMYLPIDNALKLDLKREKLAEVFELDKLQPNNASKVNAHWKYGGEGEEEVLAGSIAYLGGAAGIFKKKMSGCAIGETENIRTNEDLVSWIIFLRLGTLNALHTLEEFRGKGLGRWALEAASKWVAEKGLIPLCEIEHNNDISRGLVEKIGYRLIHDVYWMKYVPLEPAKDEN